MHSRLLCTCLFLITSLAFAQTDRGTITGTVADPSGAIIASADVEAKHISTGQVYRTASTDTGNFTIVQLLAGSYELSVKVAGFKAYNR